MANRICNTPESLRLPVKRARRSEPQEEDDDDVSRVNPAWITTTECEFWVYFFKLVDQQDTKKGHEAEFKARVKGQYVDGINWNFWTDHASYKAAMKKCIERISKIGGFRRDETTKLTELTDQVLTHRQSELKVGSRSYGSHQHIVKMWTELRTSLDHPPLTWRRVADLLCDILVGMIAVSVFVLFVVGIFTFLSKYK